MTIKHSSLYRFTPVKYLIDIFSTGLFKRTVIYTLAGLFPSLVGFLLLPILTRHLSPYDYGIIETFLAVTGCLTGIIGVGSNAILSKRYFVLDSKQREVFVGNILNLIYLSTLFILALLVIFGNYFSTLINISKTLILFTVLVSMSSMIAAILLTLFQLEKASIKFTIFSNAKALFDIGLTLIFILCLGLKWEGRIGGIGLSSLIFLGVTIYIFRKRNIRPYYSKPYFKELILLGSPLILSHVSGWANNMIDRLMISSIINIQATGMYAIGYKFGMIIMMLETAFSRAWLPYFYEKIEGNKSSDKLSIVRVTYMYIAGLIFVSLFFGVFAKYLLYFMVDERFFAASKFIFLISMGYCFGGIWKMFTGYLIHKGMTKIYSGIVFISAAVNITLNYILLKKFGLIGAAWATFASFGVGALLTMFVAIKSYPMPWLNIFKPDNADQ